MGSKTLLSAAIKKKRGVSRANFSLREAATLAGIDYNAMYRAENGKNITAQNFVKLCEWLELDPRKVEIG